MAFWLWIALAVAAAAIVAAMFSQIKVRVRYSRSGKLDQLVVIVQALFGLFRYQILLPSIVIRGWNVVYREQREGGLPGKEKDAKAKRMLGRRTVRRYIRAYRTVLVSTKQFKRWARTTLKKVECTRWRLDFRVGTGDAASTAVLTGLLWAVSGCATGVADRLISLRASPHGEVTPNYSSPEFTVVWEADFRIRLGTAVAAFFKLGISTVRIGRAIRAWRSWLTPPSEGLS
ncbi:Protein of unknown function (DUF2953) [Cohnella sp. SGD-V74]|uniref:DUF2953 domain-containing protein n=1 Tax=unclassified Cohnella TaxID=2636738 RepID=UPI000D41A432|nr:MULTISPECIES: DUF2953 domain-containing protein [unclassified Cohnella]PRX73828.1 Protein of unknown function (DUF2953) [Cohnella sp. SGD-V74]